MLKDRLAVGIIGAILAIALLLFGNELLIGVIISVIAIIGLTEMYNAIGFFKNNIPLAIIGYIAGLLILIFTSPGGIYGFYLLTGFTPLVFAFISILLIYMIFFHNKTSFSDVSTCFFSTFYVVFFFAHLILIRKHTDGKFLIWIPIIIAWLSDTMAYTFGRLFGKHKLIPEVSPKKTVEGAIGGVFGGVVFMLIYGAVCAFAFNRNVNWVSLVILGITGAILSQFGDLAASWIKRERGIKDYGNLLPGHGGVMDRFDSVLVVAPFVFYYIQIFPVI